MSVCPGLHVARYVETAEALGFFRNEDSRALDDDLIAEVVDAARPRPELPAGHPRRTRLMAA